MLAVTAFTNLSPLNPYYNSWIHRLCRSTTSLRSICCVQFSVKGRISFIFARDAHQVTGRLVLNNRVRYTAGLITDERRQFLFQSKLKKASGLIRRMNDQATGMGFFPLSVPRKLMSTLQKDQISGHEWIMEAERIRAVKMNYNRDRKSFSGYPNEKIDESESVKLNHHQDLKNLPCRDDILLSKKGSEKPGPYCRSFVDICEASGSIDVSAPLKLSSLNRSVNAHLNAAVGTEQRNSLVEQKSEEQICHVTAAFLTSSPKKTEKEFLRQSLLWIYDKTLIVDNIATAKEVVHRITQQYGHLVHACDTEVANIDVKKETPVDHGELICFSIYSGEGVDYGNGKSFVWVDTLDGGGKDVLLQFRPFFENPSIKKVWHNYSFDSHIIENYGIKLCGFHADTMHMARLFDSSRRGAGGYSLESLTSDPRLMPHAQEREARKESMKTLFSRKKMRKDGREGKMSVIDPVEVLQRNDRATWICYSVKDSMSTHGLYENLKKRLLDLPWKSEGDELGTMLDFYQKYWVPFGELLVLMETEGMLVDCRHLAEIEKVAREEQRVAVDGFRDWASAYCMDAKRMNVCSDAQLCQLFFGGAANKKNPSESIPCERTFRVPNDGSECVERGEKETAKRYRNITLHRVAPNHIRCEIFTDNGWPSTSSGSLRVLAGKLSDPEREPPAADDVSYYGTAYAAFGGGREGAIACHAISALCKTSSIDSLISNFILPLQGNGISGKNGRVHCSLNINTETGRLSARRPSLQNQPSLEKDLYRIREAFIAGPGNSLIVADYGQLELRLLAHLANCESMLEAFRAGGDFHSRTAMNMYPHIRKAVDEGTALLEWHPQSGQDDAPPAPLLKDAFASERRKAKVLNFSIAYGKTTLRLAGDLKVSMREAKRTVELWYRDKQEVLAWQEAQKKLATEQHCVYTLLGRHRNFPHTHNVSYSQRNHIERAAINTPVQGSAADVAMCAMLMIARNLELRNFGWKLLLQIHDEVILEGPTESADKAKALVINCMLNPFLGDKNILRVGLTVDAKITQNWYSAK